MTVPHHSEPAREAVADAMRKRRHELINEPLARIWPQLADAALSASPAPAAGGLEVVLAAYEAETRALPLGAASREKGDSAYNWRMSVVKDLRQLATQLASSAATRKERKPLRMLVDNEWLRDAIAASPDDAECEVRSASAATRGDAMQPAIDGFAENAEIAERIFAPVESAQVKIKPVVWEQYWDGGNDDIPSWRARTPVGLTLDVSFAGERLKKHGDADPARLAEKQAKEFARYESRIRASLALALEKTDDR